MFGYGGPLVMAGLDVTHQFRATPERIEQVAAVERADGGLASPRCSPTCSTFFSRHVPSTATTTSTGPPSTTRCAVLALTHPDLFTSRRRHVAVETAGELTRGMTVIDERTVRDRPAANCDVLTTVDAEAAFAVIVEAIAHFG